MDPSFKHLIDNKVESGLYIHIPFCRKKCLYCDFFSGGSRITDWPLYLSAVFNELSERIGELEIRPSTLYIGGGTPSLIPLDSFEFFFNRINSFIGHKNSWREFTLEVNPEDVSPQACEVWARSGVNRISLGVQSLNNDELRIIGRNCDSRLSLKALTVLGKFFENISVDLIFGLPTQTMESWKNSVREILRFQPQHISAYSLMFEEGTPITVLRDQKRMDFPEEEECVAMWRWFKNVLVESGYRQYELSNYSLPGYEAVHNSRYWAGNPYLGLGPSAHSYDGKNVRRSNPNSISGYINRFANDSGVREDNGSKGISSDNTGIISPFYMEESLSVEERLEEKIMLSLRLACGLSLYEVGKEFGENIVETILQRAKPYLKGGILTLNDDRLSLSDAGLMLADDIILNICP